jgi:hypothetical protein
MPCPISLLVGAGLAARSAHALFVQDRSGRVITLTATLVVLAGWPAYFLLARTPALRITLEVASSLVLLGSALRLALLARRGVIDARPGIRFEPLARRTMAVVGNPWVLSAKVWLAAMLVMEWRGKAHFSTLEYAAVSLVVLALVLHRVLVQRRQPGFPALESFAGGAAPAACPLGFGCAAEAGRGGDRTIVSS